MHVCVYVKSNQFLRNTKPSLIELRSDQTFFNSVHFHKFKTAQFFQLWPINPIPGINRVKGTDGNNILHTPIVKHYNDLVGRQSSERGKDEVSYFYVGDVFCVHLGTKGLPTKKLQ